MATTEWIGTTTDGALGSNWDNGVPDEATTHVTMNGTSILDIATNFGSIRARQTLAGSLQPADGDTFIINGKTYTAETPLTNVDGHFFIGATVLATHENLKAAVNLETGSGTKYAAATTLHPTVLGLSATATTSIYAAKDAGTAGNSLTTTDVSVNWAWLGATLEDGAGSGATMGNIYQEAAYPGNIHTSGTKAPINCGVYFHRGPGQISIDIVNCTRMVIDSPNYGLAADLIMTSSLTGLEIVSGRAKLHAPVGTALPDSIIVTDLMGRSENLRLTGDTSLTGTQLIVAPGRVSIDGPSWTSLENFAGHLTIVNGAVTTLRSTGRTTLKSLGTMGTAFIMGGDFELTGPGGKTVTTVWLAPQAIFHRRDDIDTFTLNEIGRK